MNSKILASEFSICHRTLLKSISLIVEAGELEDSDFASSFYTSSQNKKLPCFEISNDALIYLLSSRRTFCNTPKRRSSALKILDSIGCESRIVIGARDRFEDSFYSLLVSFFGDIKIIRSYPVSGYFVDFYIPEISLFIEYDDEYHFIGSQKENDFNRWKEIKTAITKKTDGIHPWLVRVRKGREIEGLRVIAGVACINSISTMTRVVNEETRESW